MKLVAVKDLELGMKLAKAIYTISGQMLFNAGTRLDNEAITRLKELNIYDVYILEDELLDFQIPEPISNRLRLEAVKGIKDTMESIKKKEQFDLEKVKDIIENVIDEILDQDYIVIHLNDIRSYDNYTFHHSISVTILSLIIALETGYNTSDLKKIGLGSFQPDKQ